MVQNRLKRAKNNVFGTKIPAVFCEVRGNTPSSPPYAETIVGRNDFAILGVTHLTLLQKKIRKKVFERLPYFQHQVFKNSIYFK